MKLLKQLAIVALVCYGQSVLAMSERVTQSEEDYGPDASAIKMAEYNRMLKEFADILHSARYENPAEVKNHLEAMYARYKAIRDNALPGFRAVLTPKYADYYKEYLGDDIKKEIERVKATYNL